MTIRQEDLIAMNEQIWSSMLGITLTNCELLEPPSHGYGYIGACVQLVGAWQGAVRVDCMRTLAWQAAERFQAKQESELGIEEVRDTIGELANMAAGSVKALLPQPTHISLPSVADGSDYDLSVRGGRILLQCPLQCEWGCMLVSLIERDPDTEALKCGRIRELRLQ